MSGDLKLVQRPPLAIVRHCLERLEQAAIKQDKHPVLVHTALEALDRYEREKPS